MKNVIILLCLIFTLISCTENSSNKAADNTTESNENIDSDANLQDKDDLTASLDKLDQLLSKHGNEKKAPKGESPLDKLIDQVNVDDKGTTDGLGSFFSTEAILDLLEESGASRSDLEKLINNPDSLKLLAKAKVAEREAAKENQVIQNEKNKISPELLSKKNLSTGLSLEEAILMVQAESGPEATMEKLKKIDSLAGTDVMSRMDFTEASYVLSDIERSNEDKASEEEKEAMKALHDKSGQLHSEKEAKELLSELEGIEDDIASGKIKRSPKFQRTIKHQKNSVRIFSSDIARKSAAAKKKFQALNPDLYFGENTGQTYMGNFSTAVYLPLADLSFADVLISVHHPNLMTKEAKNVLGPPDKIETFNDVTGIYSLGLGGDLTIQFVNNALTNVNGPDLYVFEIGQIEPTDLEISKNGKDWINVGKIDGGVAEVDIAPFVKQGELFYYVRLKDLKTQSALPGADVDAIAAIGAAMRLNLDSKVLFDTGKSTLKPEGMEALKTLANSIEIFERGQVIVEGHTDNIGSAENNQRLSLARAKSVSEALKKLIPSSHFKWEEKGYGASQPLVENDSDEHRGKNRRVEVLVLPN